MTERITPAEVASVASAFDVPVETLGDGPFGDALALWAARTAEILGPVLERVARALVGVDLSFLDDDVLDEGGCWADVFDEGKDDYVACGEDPAPGDELGLCQAHARRLRELRA